MASGWTNCPLGKENGTLIGVPHLNLFCPSEENERECPTAVIPSHYVYKGAVFPLVDAHTADVVERKKKKNVPRDASKFECLMLKALGKKCVAYLHLLGTFSNRKLGRGELPLAWGFSRDLVLTLWTITNNALVFVQTT